MDYCHVMEDACIFLDTFTQNPSASFSLGFSDLVMFQQLICSQSLPLILESFLASSSSNSPNCGHSGHPPLPLLFFMLSIFLSHLLFILLSPRGYMHII
jgi:hypothetical protein